MATFSRQSWHRRLMNSCFSKYHVLNIEDNFCAYWRSLSLVLVVLTTVASVAFLISLGSVYIIGALLIAMVTSRPWDFATIFGITGNSPYEVLMSISVVFALMAIFGGSIAIAAAGLKKFLEWVYDRRRAARLKRFAEQQENPKPDSFLATKYRSWKDKVCPKVDWVD